MRAIAIIIIYDIINNLVRVNPFFFFIIKTGNRLGDNAEMCFIELVDYNENMAKEKVAKKATRTRRSKKSAAAEAAPAAETAPVAEAPAAEEAKAE